MRIHQVLVSATPGDAITNAALEIRSLLRRVAPSEVFARYIHPALQDEILSLDTYDRTLALTRSDDVLLFHASIGEPTVFSFINERPERLVLVYHNISPADAFRAYDPAFAGLLEAGRADVRALADRCVLALADSEFNAQELRQMGYRDIRVSRLIVDVAEMGSVEPDRQATEWLDSMAGPVFLFVGQLLPHKRPDFLLKAFHVVTTYHLPEAQLLMVGASRLHRYTAALGGLVRELNLGRAVIRGSIDLAELVAYYRRADVFVTASEHEGFCVPLLEAMAFDVPIVAREVAAIPETSQGAALLVDEKDGVFVFAEAMLEVASNDALRGSLIAAGRTRLAHFDPDVARAELLSNLLSVV